MARQLILSRLRLRPLSNGRRPRHVVRQSCGEEGPRGGYGYQWWTVPDSDAYFALGLQGQFIYVDPATRTVVVKLSYFPPANEAATPEAVAFMAAAAWKP